MYSKDLVTNTSTGLMAIKDLATYNDIPINIHFDDHWIHIIVGFGTPYQKKMSIYPQDCYRSFGKNDQIYDDIEKIIAEIKEKKRYEKNYLH